MANGNRTGDLVVRSSVKVPEFDKHLKKATVHISWNIVEITIKMKTIVWKPLMIKIIKLRLRNWKNNLIRLYSMGLYEVVNYFFCWLSRWVCWLVGCLIDGLFNSLVLHPVKHCWPIMKSVFLFLFCFCLFVFFFVEGATRFQVTMIIVSSDNY